MLLAQLPVSLGSPQCTDQDSLWELPSSGCGAVLMLGTCCTAVRVCGLKAKVLCRVLLQSLAGHSDRQQGTVAMLLDFVR